VKTSIKEGPKNSSFLSVRRKLHEFNFGPARYWNINIGQEKKLPGTEMALKQVGLPSEINYILLLGIWIFLSALSNSKNTLT